MKDLLFAFVEFFFEIDSNKEYTLKELLIIMLKVAFFLLLLAIILYFLLNKTETITISD